MDICLVYTLVYTLLCGYNRTSLCHNLYWTFQSKITIMYIATADAVTLVEASAAMNYMPYVKASPPLVRRRGSAMMMGLSYR
jgi:hypothetical protein